MKVISYSLYGNDPRYVVNAIFNAEQAAEFYPEWQARFYIDNTVPTSIVKRLTGFSHVKVINMTNEYLPRLKGLKHSPRMLWRYYAYDDPKVGTVLFRDTDSYLSKREADAVAQWLDTKRAIHLMREVQPGHGSKIMGGMWGIRRTPKIKSFLKLLKERSTGYYQTDQNFLNDIIYPLFEAGDRVVHDQDNIFNDATHEWPSPRFDDMFIGRTQGPPCYESGLLDRYHHLIGELL